MHSRIMHEQIKPVCRFPPVRKRIESCVTTPLAIKIKYDMHTGAPRSTNKLPYDRQWWKQINKHEIRYWHYNNLDLNKLHLYNSCVPRGTFPLKAFPKNSVLLYWYDTVYVISKYIIMPYIQPLIWYTNLYKGSAIYCIYKSYWNNIEIENTNRISCNA